MKRILNPTMIGIIGLLVASVVSMPWDAKVAQWFRDNSIPGDIEAAVRFSEVFAHGYGVVAILITLAIIDRMNRKGLLFAGLSAALAGLIANLIKLNVARYRPQAIEALTDQPAWMIGFVGLMPWRNENVDWLNRSLQAFPSGHTAAAFGLAAGLMAVYPQGRIWFLFLASMAGFQRVVAGAHFPSDVFAGAAVGIACGAFTMRFAKRRSKK